MCWLPVHTGSQLATFTAVNTCVQEGQLVVHFRFMCEFDVVVTLVDEVGEAADVASVLDHKCVVDVVHPKDPVKPKDRAGVVYKVSCGDCDASYIGQTGRKLGERLAEHQNSISRRPESSAVGQHSADTGHEIEWGNTEILGRDAWENRRLIREAIRIRQCLRNRVNFAAN